MASGTISLGNSGTLYGQIVWSSVSNGADKNTSTVTAKLQAKKASNTTTGTTGTWTGYLTIGGTQKTVSNHTTVEKSWVTLYEFSKTVAHNDDGSGTCSIAGQINGPTGTTQAGYTVTGSATVTLDTIPRYAFILQTVLDRTETRIQVKWTSDATIDRVWYSIDGGTTWSNGWSVNAKSGTYTIENLSPNTSYQIQTRCRRKDSQLSSTSQIQSFKTYQYPYIESGSDFYIGSEHVRFNVYNPLNREVTVRVILADGNYMETIGTGRLLILDTSTSAKKTMLYASIPNAKSARYSVSVIYGQSTQTKSNVGTYTIVESECTPVVGTVTYRDTNTITTAVTGDNQKIIRNKSTVRYTVSGVTVKKSATVASVKVKVLSNQYTLSLSGSNYVGGNAVIDSASNVSARVTVTDSRGLTASVLVPITMWNWVLPTATITLERENNFYSASTLWVDAHYSSLGGNNSINIKYQIRPSSQSSGWTYQGTVQTDPLTYNFNADNTQSWYVAVTVWDIFGSETGTEGVDRNVYRLTLPKGMPVIFFDKNLSSVGINCFPKDTESLELNGFNVARCAMTRGLTADKTTLSTGSYTKVPLDTSANVGDSRLTVTSDGGIKIGANVSKIMVSANLAITATSTQAVRRARIGKNTSGTSDILAFIQQTIPASAQDNLSLPPVVVDVAQNDVIYLFYYVTQSADTINGTSSGNRTYLTVEVIG
ncbi:MAG: hypothetical protein IJI45_18375 [Anaerolineaceae bacterium]|nr:hypothetical protein [Anaerolineaceae bacterium]